jgi:trehalose 6-phosphate phosphatase
LAEELRSVEPLRPLLALSPLAILSDIDGTVAPIVPHPEDARISERAHAAIQRLISAGVRVAFVTGRALEMARSMVDIPKVDFAANHGLNICVSGQAYTLEEVRPYASLAQRVLEEIGEIDIPGIVVEDKGPVLAFHYRLAPSEAQAIAGIQAALKTSPTAESFRIQEGRKVIELRPPLAIDKGTAVADLVQRLGGVATIVLGDDATDMDMFRGQRQLQTEGTPGASVAVWSPEINPAVLEATDYYVQGVEGVEWLLEEILTALPRSSG